MEKPFMQRALLSELLERLDALLQLAYTRAQQLYERKEAGEPRPWAYRGMYVSEEEAAQAFARPAGTPSLSAVDNDALALEAFAKTPLWGLLGQRLNLSGFDIAVTMLALAPEIDLRYARLYAYLQDDVTRRRPTVNLALDVLSSDIGTKFSLRQRFSADAPLLRTGLLQLTSDPNQVSPTLLDRYLSLDDEAVSFLLGEAALDQRLSRFCQVLEAKEDAPLEDESLQGLVPLLLDALKYARPLQLYFWGVPGVGQRMAAESLARAVGAPLLVADFTLAAASWDRYDQQIEIVLRAAMLRAAVVLLTGIDALLRDDHSERLATFWKAVATHPGAVILSSAQPWLSLPGVPNGVVVVPFSAPDFDARRTAWQTQLRDAEIPDDARTLDLLANRFQLSQEQIASAVATAGNRMRWNAAKTTIRIPSVVDELLAAARAQAGHELRGLASKLVPVYTWTDIVLPPATRRQLEELCARVEQRQRVFDEWGFGAKLSYGKGVSALFTGPSGSGKTMAAEVLATALAVDLYRIELASVVSKYIGETEQRLERIFSAAERTNAILFFDEADALFGKRSEIHDAHDRYANIEVSYLLQRMEQYEGVAILATNLRGNLDDAFVRRLAFAVQFPFPDEAQRKEIWEKVWPSHELLAPDVDLSRLASQFRLSGGNIRNVALAAAFLAAPQGGRVTTQLLLRALQREYQKVGKNTSEEELRAGFDRERVA
jgi:AAA+ superfamily predicted ATPase